MEMTAGTIKHHLTKQQRQVHMRYPPLCGVAITDSEASGLCYLLDLLLRKA